MDQAEKEPREVNWDHVKELTQEGVTRLADWEFDVFRAIFDKAAEFDRNRGLHIIDTDEAAAKLYMDFTRVIRRLGVETYVAELKEAASRTKTKTETDWFKIAKSLMPPDWRAN